MSAGPDTDLLERARSDRKALRRLGLLVDRVHDESR
jgi:hypothetical protein